MRRAMHARSDTVDVHVRVTESLYQKMVADCLIDQCSLSTFIRKAITDAICVSYKTRGREPLAPVLKGQTTLGESDAG
jgi:hypothetical protein